MAAGCVIGVDLGGTKLLAGAIDADFNVRHRAVRRSRAGGTLRSLLDTLADAVEECRVAAGGEIAAVGFGIPSLIDTARGVAVTTVHLPLQDVPFKALMAERLGVPVAVDNDANTALVAEHRLGAARGTKTAALLTLGTGIGGALVIDGRLLRGASGAAGEWGHMVVELEGQPCTPPCRNRGCLETVVSGSALGRDGAALAAARPESHLGRALAGGREITGAVVTDLAQSGDEDARGLIAAMGRRLGVGLANIVNVINPEVIVMGGGVLAAGDLLLDPAREELAARALAPSRDVVRIVPSHFGDASGMLGAGLLAADLIGGVPS